MTDPRHVAITITGTAGDVSGGDMQKNTTTTTTEATGDVTAPLTALIEALRASPPEHTDAAAAVTSMAHLAVQEATKPAPNALLTRISADGLVAAATQIAAVMPTVLPLAQRLADALRGMV